MFFCLFEHPQIFKARAATVAYINLFDLNWFGSLYSGKAKTFYTKSKRGAKKGGRVKNAESAYIRGD